MKEGIELTKSSRNNQELSETEYAFLVAFSLPEGQRTKRGQECVMWIQPQHVVVANSYESLYHDYGFRERLLAEMASIGGRLVHETLSQQLPQLTQKLLKDPEYRKLVD